MKTIKLNEGVNRPFGPPIYHGTVPSTLIDIVTEEARKNLNNEKLDYRGQLAGNFTNGMSIELPYGNNARNKIDNAIHEHIEQFFKEIKLTFAPIPPTIYKLAHIWINFQQKYDFNPPHEHFGFLSFILFGDIDERIFTENLPKSGIKKAGHVTFMHGTTYNTFEKSNVTVKPKKGDLYIFPADLTHYVTPFWIDAERISMSGNYVLEQSNIPQG